MPHPMHHGGIPNLPNLFPHNAFAVLRPVYPYTRASKIPAHDPATPVRGNTANRARDARRYTARLAS